MKRAITALALLSMTACGPDPLTVWKVSLFEGEIPNSCYVDNIPPEDQHQTGIQVDLGTWELYEGPEDKYFLAGVKVRRAADDSLFDEQTLEGTLSDGVYTFDVTDTYIDRNDATGPTRTRTHSIQTTIKLTVDGETFSGTWTEAESWKCEGSDCEADFGVNHPACTVEHQLKGAQVEVENLHAL